MAGAVAAWAGVLPRCVVAVVLIAPPRSARGSRRGGLLPPPASAGASAARRAQGPRPGGPTHRVRHPGSASRDATSRRAEGPEHRGTRRVVRSSAPAQGGTMTAVSARAGTAREGREASPNTPMLTFLGAAGTVTGSRFLVERGEHRILVDAGLYQGLAELRRRNWDEFPVPPEPRSTTVVLTHAHLDHCGYLPRLVRDGFGGRCVCTPQTAALARDRSPRQRPPPGGGRSLRQRGRLVQAPPRPAALRRPLTSSGRSALRPRAVRRAPVRSTGDAEPRAPAGRTHPRLGVAVLTRDGQRVVFSGDLGRPHHPLLRPPPPPPAGLDTGRGRVDLRRPTAPGSRSRVLADAISRTIAAGRRRAPPCVRRRPHRAGAAGAAPATRRGRDPRRARLHRQPDGTGRARGLPDSPGRRLRPSWWPIGHPPCPVSSSWTSHQVPDVAGSERLNRPSPPCIIISASGMATGGRVVHHLAHQLPDTRNCVILTGYQAQGTRGRQLLEGATHVKMHGRYVSVRAEVVDVAGLLRARRRGRAARMGGLGRGTAPHGVRRARGAGGIRGPGTTDRGRPRSVCASFRVWASACGSTDLGDKVPLTGDQRPYSAGVRRARVGA